LDQRKSSGGKTKHHLLVSCWGCNYIIKERVVDIKIVRERRGENLIPFSVESSKVYLAGNLLHLFL